MSGKIQWSRLNDKGGNLKFRSKNTQIPFFLGKPTVVPFSLAGSATHKSGGRRVKSWPDATHKQTLTPVVLTCDLCHKQLNKHQTSIRCYHTHNTHWVHLKCTQINQRQYKPDWRCTVHTHTQLVTTTPSTSNTTAHHQQTSPSPTKHHTPTTTHPQHSTKGQTIVILQININGIRNKIEELENLVHSTQPDRITIQETKLTQKDKTPNILYHHTHRQGRETRRGIITIINDDIIVANTYFPPGDTT